MGILSEGTTSTCTSTQGPPSVMEAASVSVSEMVRMVNKKSFQLKWIGEGVPSGQV